MIMIFMSLVGTKPYAYAYAYVLVKPALKDIKNGMRQVKTNSDHKHKTDPYAYANVRPVFTGHELLCFCRSVLMFY